MLPPALRKMEADASARFAVEQARINSSGDEQIPLLQQTAEFSMARILPGASLSFVRRAGNSAHDQPVFLAQQLRVFCSLKSGATVHQL